MTQSEDSYRIEQALASTDATYLALETELRSRGRAALEALAPYVADADSVARLFARTLIAWIDGTAPANDTALAYLEQLPREVAETPAAVPRTTGVPAYLGYHFGAAVTSVMALRLLKVPSLPRWYALGVILYLHEQRDPSTTEALLRYARVTRDEERRRFAIDALRGMGDPALLAKLEAERAFDAARWSGIADALTPSSS